MKALAPLIYLVPLILHSIGLFVLLKMPSTVTKSQKVLLINLCLSEIYLTLCSGLYRVLMLIYGESNCAYAVLRGCSLCASILYYITMYIITLDRFFHVYFNLRYSAYCTARKITYITVSVWITSFLLPVPSFVNYLKQGNRIRSVQKPTNITYKYVFPSCDLLFLLIAMVTYGYIITKIKQNRRTAKKLRGSLNSRSCESTTSNGSATTKRFRKRNRYHLLLPTLLIATFLIFIAIPDFFWFLSSIDVITISPTLQTIFGVLFSLGYSSDAVIYILFSTSLRQKLARRFRVSRLENMLQDSSSTVKPEKKTFVVLTHRNATGPIKHISKMVI
ncbi:alpha-2C adrenergic receptor-like [Hydractinia symbiolongicarpus]|uniref:alpha-2C adrenergic receptor-like n=1 Tax=Hydractinia symbiolongicarpus TaxID=13093 RepID=UPI00254F8564|nr:alpha-2C adrenergic receptor-like [Hydractinia symbiolongicarpus]